MNIPSNLEVDAYSTSEKSALEFCGPMNKLEFFKNMGMAPVSAESSTSWGAALTISSRTWNSPCPIPPTAELSRSSRPFCALVTFKVDVREMRGEVDIFAISEGPRSVSPTTSHSPSRYRLLARPHAPVHENQDRSRAMDGRPYFPQHERVHRH